MSESEEQQQPQADLPTAGYEAAEEERRSLEKEEERDAHVASQDEESSPEPAEQQKRDETRVKQRHTTIGATASAWQVTLFDLDKQLNRHRALMERMADDIKHLRKQFNQVQRDLAKFEKRMGKMRTTTSSSAKRRKRRG
ncbi:MAG: hypothetical protein M3114_05465 [Thermoproteota archaeon]|nr:hypothetical protein [Thermoproteota archaeon]